MCVYGRYAPALPHENASKIKFKKKRGKSVKPFGKERIRIRMIRPVPPQITDSIQEGSMSLR